MLGIGIGPWGEATRSSLLQHDYHIAGNFGKVLIRDLVNFSKVAKFKIAS